MGKGDKRSKKGKIFMGTFGVSRPRTAAASTAPTEKPAAKKATTKKKAAKSQIKERFAQFSSFYFEGNR